MLRGVLQEKKTEGGMVSKCPRLDELIDKTVCLSIHAQNDASPVLKYRLSTCVEGSVIRAIVKPKSSMKPGKVSPQKMIARNGSRVEGCKLNPFGSAEYTVPSNGGVDSCVVDDARFKLNPTDSTKYKVSSYGGMDACVVAGAEFQLNPTGSAKYTTPSKGGVDGGMVASAVKETSKARGRRKKKSSHVGSSGNIRDFFIATPRGGKGGKLTPDGVFERQSLQLGGKGDLSLVQDSTADQDQHLAGSSAPTLDHYGPQD